MRVATRGKLWHAPNASAWAFSHSCIMCLVATPCTFSQWIQHHSIWVTLCFVTVAKVSCMSLKAVCTLLWVIPGPYVFWHNADDANLPPAYNESNECHSSFSRIGHVLTWKKRIAYVLIQTRVSTVDMQS